MGLTLADRRRLERMAVDEAVAKRAGGYIDRAVSPEMSIPVHLGDELIDCGRAVVRAYYTKDKRRLDRAVRWMVKLVGGAP